MAQQTQAIVEIPAVNAKIVTLTIVSLPHSQLLVNRMTDEIKRGLDPNEKDKTGAKRKVYPTKEIAFEQSKYKTLEGKEGLPATKFSKALGAVAPMFDKKVSKTMLNKCVSILNGEGPEQIIPFNGTTVEAIFHTGIERVMGNPVVRHRALYTQWSLDLEIEWNDDVFSLDVITNLINHTGRWVGVGEHCPGARMGGDNGRFEIEVS